VNALVAILCGFIAENFPDIQGMIFAGIPSLIWGTACLWVAGALKRDREWKTGYTRKVFHFLTFVSAAVIQRVWGLPILCVFGAGVSAVVFSAVLGGQGILRSGRSGKGCPASHAVYFGAVFGNLDGWHSCQCPIS